MLRKSNILPCKELANPKKFQTHETTKDILMELTNGDIVRIEKGFKFDGRSSPKILKMFFPTWNKADYAYLLHDWLYVVDYRRDEIGWIRSKLFSDCNMYSRAMKDNPGMFWRWAFWDNFLSFIAVVVFGSKVYKLDRESND